MINTQKPGRPHRWGGGVPVHLIPWFRNQSRLIRQFLSIYCDNQHYVREKQRKKSDIDILVTFNRDIDLFDFLDLREYLENQLHAKVDLVMESALKPAIGKRILSEVEYV